MQIFLDKYIIYSYLHKKVNHDNWQCDINLAIFYRKYRLSYIREGCKVYIMDTGKRAIRRFGKRVQQLRKSKRWSQQELAARLDVEQSYVSDVERGIFGPSFARLAKIAEAFDMTIAELCDSI